MVFAVPSVSMALFIPLKGGRTSLKWNLLAPIIFLSWCYFICTEPVEHTFCTSSTHTQIELIALKNILPSNRNNENKKNIYVSYRHHYKLARFDTMNCKKFTLGIKNEYMVIKVVVKSYLYWDTCHRRMYIMSCSRI